jgi:hypothetical protein
MFYTDGWVAGTAHMRPASVGFLIAFGTIGILLWRRSQKAWWLTVLLVGGAGLFLLEESWEPMSRVFPWLNAPPMGWNSRMTEGEIAWYLFWMGSRVALHLAVPVFLVLGRLRKPPPASQP